MEHGDVFCSMPFSRGVMQAGNREMSFFVLITKKPRAVDIY